MFQVWGPVWCHKRAMSCTVCRLEGKSYFDRRFKNFFALGSFVCNFASIFLHLLCSYMFSSEMLTNVFPFCHVIR